MTRPPSYDEGRAVPRACQCGRHWVTGYWSRLFCPFAAPRVTGRWGVLWADVDAEAAE